jgi:hypothetical protein
MAAFRTAVEQDRPTEPLVLTSDDLNALIEERPDWKGKVYVEIEQDKLKGQVSIPLSDLPSFGLTRGRYLNGQAEFNVWLKDGVPVATITSLEVNGKHPSDEFMNGIKNQNLIKDLDKDSELGKAIHKLKSVEIKDGKMILAAQDPTKAPEGGRPEASPRDDTREGKVSTHPAEKLPPPANGARTLPDDVLAPPDSPPAAPVESTKKP